MQVFLFPVCTTHYYTLAQYYILFHGLMKTILQKAWNKRLLRTWQHGYALKVSYILLCHSLDDGTEYKNALIEKASWSKDKADVDWWNLRIVKVGFHNFGTAIFGDQSDQNWPHFDPFWSLFSLLSIYFVRKPPNSFIFYPFNFIRISVFQLTSWEN